MTWWISLICVACGWVSGRAACPKNWWRRIRRSAWSSSRIIFQGFQKLKDGTLDAMVADRWVAAFLLAEKGIAGVQTSDVPLAQASSAIAVRKGDAALLAMINTGLRSLQADGSLARIKAKWQPKEIFFQTREQASHETLVAVVMVLGVLLVVVAIWILTLTRRSPIGRTTETVLRASEERMRLFSSGRRRSWTAPRPSASRFFRPIAFVSRPMTRSGGYSAIRWRT